MKLKPRKIEIGERDEAEQSTQDYFVEAQLVKRAAPQLPDTLVGAVMICKRLDKLLEREAS